MAELARHFYQNNSGSVTLELFTRGQSQRMAMRKPLETPFDWYGEFCQRLEALRLNAPKYADKDEVIPPDWAFIKVKNEIQNIRQLAGFPKVPVPDVWLGPDGDIGLTWDIEERTLDLIFGWGKFTARLSDDSEQQLIEQKDIPSVLAKLAA